MVVDVFTSLTPEVRAHVGRERVVWLDLENPSDAQIDELADCFGLHPISVADLRAFGQRARLQRLGDQLSGVAYGAEPGGEAGRPVVREVHLFAGAGWLVTVHREPMADLAGLRARAAAHGEPTLAALLYSLLIGLAESFFVALDALGEQIDEVENGVLEEARPEQVAELIDLRRELVHLRRVVSPQRDMFTTGMEAILGLPAMPAGHEAYVRDVRDHFVRVGEMIDAQRDLLAGAMDLYLSTVANQQAEINKQLTLIASIFLPLTFVTGFFGQNFAWMVGELIRTQTAFWVFGVGSLVLSGVALAWFFRRRGWW